MSGRLGPRRLALIVCALFLAMSGQAAAQLPGLASQGAPPPAPSDPLGRESPAGTVTGFSTAVHREDFAVAARFLQAGARSAREIENLSRDLSVLLDRYFIQPLPSLSRAAAGSLTDGLDGDRERIPLTIGTRSVDIFLTRVTDPVAGPIWLFSADSLGRVPTLSRSQQATLVERLMPESLTERSYFGISLAQWILLAVTIAGPLLVFSALSLLVARVGRRRIDDLARRAIFLSWWSHVRWLVIVALTLGAHLAVLPLLGFSLTFRVAYGRIGLVGAVLVLALLVWRLVSVTFHQASLLAIRRGRSDTRSLIQFSERVVKVMVVLISIIGLLSLAGVDATTALAGVGIAGVAVALGAQKSVENLLGGIFLLSDRALAVGDYCRLLDRDGWVEDITLRSVQLRTLEQTLLSVPAGLLAQGSIENFATRSKILVQSVVRLRYGTTGEQLQAVLEGTRQLLTKHPALDKESARFRLVAFGPQAIEIELFAYVTTSEFAKFLEVRENLLLQIAQIVESSGSAFAMPTEFIHTRADGAEVG